MPRRRRRSKSSEAPEIVLAAQELVIAKLRAVFQGEPVFASLEDALDLQDQENGGKKVNVFERGNIPDAWHAADVSADAMKSLVSVQLSCGGFSAVPSFVWHCSQLQELMLDANELEHLGVSDASVAFISTLTSLHLHRNRLKVVPSLIPHLRNLTVLTLSHNQLTDIPGELFDMIQRLRRLHLAANKLTSLPASIGRLKDLQMLDVRGNPIGWLDAGIVYPRSEHESLKSLQMSVDSSQVPPTIVPRDALGEPFIVSLKAMSAAVFQQHRTSLSGPDADVKSLPRELQAYVASPDALCVACGKGVWEIPPFAIGPLGVARDPPSGRFICVAHPSCSISEISGLP